MGIIYYVLTSIVTNNDVWMDRTFLKSTKAQHPKINYTVLQQKILIITEKFAHISG